VTSLPPGTVDARKVRSRSEPGKTYDMARTRGGWHHTDEGCGAWMNVGRCRHVDELNEEAKGGKLMVLPVGGDPLAKIEELDDQAIISALEGSVSETWAYSFAQDGKAITGLSIVGVEQAAREMAKLGEALREESVNLVYEDEREGRFVAHVARYAVNGAGREVLLDSAIRAKRQPKFMKLRDGSEKFDQHWFEKGVGKALRNAKAALIADAVRQRILAIASGARPTGGAARPAVRRSTTARSAPIEGEVVQSPAHTEGARPVRTVAQGTPLPEKGEVAVPKVSPAQAADAGQSPRFLLNVALSAAFKAEAQRSEWIAQHVPEAVGPQGRINYAAIPEARASELCEELGG